MGNTHIRHWLNRIKYLIKKKRRDITIQYLTVIIIQGDNSIQVGNEKKIKKNFGKYLGRDWKYVGKTENGNDFGGNGLCGFKLN